MSDAEDRKLLADELESDGWPEMAALIRDGGEDEFNKIMWVNLAIRAIAKARAQERERVVAYLRESYLGKSEYVRILVADRIERGDHLKGTSE